MGGPDVAAHEGGSGTTSMRTVLFHTQADGATAPHGERMDGQGRAGRTDARMRTRAQAQVDGRTGGRVDRLTHVRMCKHMYRCVQQVYA